VQLQKQKENNPMRMTNQTWKKLALLTVSAAALGSAIACSSDPASTSSGGSSSSGSSGASGGSSGASGGSSGASGGSSGASGGSSGTAAKNFGLISVSQTVFEFTPGMKTYSSSAFASFGKAAGATGVAPSNCTSSKEGVCTVVVCDAPAAPMDAGAPVDAGAPPKAVNAGEINITGGDAPIKLTPGATGAYAPFTAQTKIYSDGQTLKAVAAGADVPTFDQSNPVPGAIVVTAPTCMTGMCESAGVDTTKAYEFKWTGGKAGTVTASLSTTELATMKSAIVSCSFDAATGMGTVPAAAMAKLLKADGTKIFGTISASPGVSKTFSAGDYEVVYSVTASGASGTFKTK
jgi:hypothetical protein